MTLYRKYRPQKFSEIEGQGHIVKTLQNELATDKLAHAYLFAGPRGTGKTTIARLLAKAVNCKSLNGRKKRQGKIEPCNRCTNCKEIIAGKSLDLIEIDAASNRGIDEIRSLRENVRFAPHHSEYKVFIIDEVHMLTREAFNALLKTLEEPPSHTLFILATTEVHKVIPTILSRCQCFNFRKLNVEQIVRRLKKLLRKENRKIDNEILNLIAQRADGAIRDAESFLGQILTWQSKEISLENVADFLGTVGWSAIFGFLHLLIAQKKEKAIRSVSSVVREGYDLKNFSEKVVECLRKMMLAKVNLDLVDYGEKIFSEREKKELLGFVEKVSLRKLAYLIKLFVQAKNSQDFYPIPELPLELAIIDYCGKGKEGVQVADRPDKKTKAVSRTENRQSPQAVKKQNSTDDLGEVTKRWNEILDAVQPLNYSLCAFLKLCRPVAFKNGSLILGFPRDFHKNIVSQDNNRKIVEKALDETLGGKWRIQCERIESNPKENHLTREVLDVFGGEVMK